MAKLSVDRRGSKLQVLGISTLMRSELINGTGYGLKNYQKVKEDWFSLLRQGVRMTGTATSDSHSDRAEDLVLQPRTMVKLDSAFDAKNFDQTAFVNSIRSGKAYGTSGPMLDIDIGGGGNWGYLGSSAE